jgi:hypothetical protein
LDPCSDYNFDDCTLDEPIEALFTLKLSKPENQDSVLVFTYRGKIDDGERIDSFYSYATEETYYLKVNRYYSAMAEYYIGGDTIRVVNGQELRTVKTTRCEETCWKIKGDELDLRLKF